MNTVPNGLHFSVCPRIREALELPLVKKTQLME